MKMKFAESLKPTLQILKKNLFSIIFGILAVLAVVSKFYPLAGMYKVLQGELNERVSVDQHVQSLLSAQRHMPILSPDQTNPDVLDVFPTQEVIDAGKNAVAAVTSQADKLVQAAVQKNTHAILFPNALPTPDDPTKYSFAQKYIAETTNYARWQQILNSCGTPTPDEVTAATNQKQAAIFAQYGVVPGGPDSPALRQAQESFTEATTTLKQDMEIQRSQQFSVYLEPGALPYFQSIGTTAGKLPDAGQIWDAQLGVWIVDDVTSAIARINKEYSDPDSPGGPPDDVIVHAPIKQLQSLQNIAQSNSGKPDDLQAGVGSPTPVAPNISSTGRVTNALYDVYQFDLRLVVDADKIPQILRDFQLDQFITVLNVQILEVVDPAVAAQSGYRYGDKPLVTLEITGEDLLMKNWTADLLPDSRKGGTASLPNGQSATPTNNESGNE
jgi:hypothetical protein